MTEPESPDLAWKIVKDELRVEIKVAAGSRRNALGPVNAGRIKVAVTTVAEHGKANRAVQALLADQLELPVSAIEVRTGLTNPRKTIVVRSDDPGAVAGRLSRLLGTS